MSKSGSGSNVTKEILNGGGWYKILGGMDKNVNFVKIFGIEIDMRSKNLKEKGFKSSNR